MKKKTQPELAPKSNSKSESKLAQPVKKAAATMKDSAVVLTKPGARASQNAVARASTPKRGQEKKSEPTLGIVDTLKREAAKVGAMAEAIVEVVQEEFSRATRSAKQAPPKTSKQAPAKKAPAKKAPAKKVPAKKAPAKKVPAKTAPAKTAPAKKAPAKKAPAKKR